MKPHASLALAFAGAVLAPTPKPFDPTGKLKALFALVHPNMVDPVTKDPIIHPPVDEVDPDAPVTPPEDDGE